MAAKLPNTRAARWRSRCVIGAIAAVVLSTSAAWITHRDEHTALADAGIKTAPAVRRSLSRHVFAHGTLGAWKSTRLISECYWDTRIISLLPEGTEVRKGDIICELDATRPRDYAQSRRIRLIRVKSELETARVQSQLVELRNGRRTRASEFNLTSATDAFAEYRDGTEPMTRAKLDRQGTVAGNRLDRAREQELFAEGLLRQGYSTTTRLNATQADVREAELALDAIEGRAELHDAYQADRELFALEGDLNQARANVDATKLRNSLSLTQAEFAELSDNRRFAHYTRYLGYALKSIDACTIRAPHDGRVLYANDWHRRSYGRADIEEGAEVDYRQAIIDLPDYSHFVVKAWVHEAQIEDLEIGQPVTVTVPALDHRQLDAHVSEIARFPTARNRYDRGLKEFEVGIEFDAPADALDGVSPRMDAKVEILVEYIDDTLQIPIESVLHDGDGPEVLVSKGLDIETRTVELGQTDEERVEVLFGVDEGELVIVEPSEELQRRAQANHEMTLAGE